MNEEREKMMEVIIRSPECLLEEVVLECPNLTWNQVFCELDRLNRTGHVRLTAKVRAGTPWCTQGRATLPRNEGRDWIMQSPTAKEPRKRKAPESIPNRELSVPEKEPVHCQPVSPCDDLHVRIANRAYELHVERGYREGYAIDDWLEAEREILGLECHA